MWSTIANFKDNLTQIASDVLDSADDLGLDGSPREQDDEAFGSARPTSAHGIRNSPNLKAELEWYRGEVSRLQAAESEIQQLSINYVALLKEREDEVVRLREENDILRRKTVVGDGAQSCEAPVDFEMVAMFKDQTQSLQNGHLENFHSSITQPAENFISEHQDQSWSNGNCIAPEEFQKLNEELRRLQTAEKDLQAQIVQRDETLEKRSSAVAETSVEVERLNELLRQEKEAGAQLNSQLQSHSDASASAVRESESLKAELQKAFETVRHLEEEARKHESTYETTMGEYKAIVSSLEKVNRELQEDRNRLFGEMEDLRLKLSGTEAVKELESSNLINKDSGAELARLTEQVTAAESALSAARLDHEAKLEKAYSEKDKVARDLARLKQHLLDKELADSEKMDQDSEQIADLQARAEASVSRALQAEQALAQTRSELLEVRRQRKDESLRFTDEIDSLRLKLSSCIKGLESKDVELANLQSALGQFYAETEARDRLFVELSVSREEVASLARKLQAACQEVEESKVERDAALNKLAAAEKKGFEAVQKILKMEEDNLRLRRALEQSMTRLNSLSSDSDYNVDRRIVIKLLVTYFQKNHSREVLDLMVRMLGFSDEDKKRVGFAQQNAGRGVVRGVLGLPGRFVGGLIGSASADSLVLPTPTENQSFADLWIDFLLKESEEREKREKAEAAKSGAANSLQGNEGVAFSSGPSTHSTQQWGYSPDASAKGSMSTPPFPTHSAGHRPSNSFSGFVSSGEFHRVENLRTGQTNGQRFVSGLGDDLQGKEFSNISLTAASTSSSPLSAVGLPNAKLPLEFNIDSIVSSLYVIDFRSYILFFVR